MPKVPENLWLRPDHQVRGPQPAHSRVEITAAAIRLADAGGLERISMRRLAAELDAGTMSLYRYVANKDELLDLMVDQVLAELELPAAPTGDWRADQMLLAHRLRALALAHPWFLEARAGRFTFGPHQLRVVEFSLASLAVTGLGIDELMIVYGLVWSYTEGFVREEAYSLAQSRSRGLSSEEWYLRSAPRVRQILESGEFPMVSRLVIEARQPHMKPDERFAYGLQHVLDAVAASLPPEPPAP